MVCIQTQRTWTNLNTIKLVKLGENSRIWRISLADLTILTNFYHFCYCLHFWTYLVWFRIINYFSFWAPKGLFQSGRNGKQKLKGFKPPSSTWRELAAEVKWYVMIIIVIFAFIYQFILIQITVTNDQYASSI